MIPTVDPGPIRELILRWAVHRAFAEGGLAALAERLTRGVDVPDALAATVTARSPWREEVLADARLWLACPKPFGLGLEVYVPEALAGRAEGPWDQVVGPVRALLTWADRMDPFAQQVQSQPLTFTRLAMEGGAWRVAGLWEPAEREELLRQAALLRRVAGG